jgi:two-component system, LytTR family, response regulator
MITACVVDDEPLAVRRLVRLLERTGRVTVAGSTSDPFAAATLVAERAPEVLFLDVEMPELNGFELLDRLSLEHMPLVVFTTAFDRYALAAFETNSVDYLVKPIDAGRLARALDKIDRLRPGDRPDVRVLARELAGQLARPRGIDRLASRVGERTLLLDVSRISHFVARDKLTFASIGGKEHVVDRTLTQLEAVLDPDRFVRIHRTTIVNLALVSEIDRWIDGGVLVRLRDERRTELPVARDRVRALKERLRTPGW